LGIIDTIKTRRSVRKFREEPVSEEAVDAILEAGRWAPSGLNNQPWRFAVVRNREIITRISKLTHYGRIVLGAQVLIPVFLDTAKIYHREKDIQGIGAVWLGEIIKGNQQIKSLLGLGDELELMAVIALGWPAESPRTTKRRSLKELIVYRD